MTVFLQPFVTCIEKSISASLISLSCSVNESLEVLSRGQVLILVGAVVTDAHCRLDRVVRSASLTVATGLAGVL